MHAPQFLKVFLGPILAAVVATAAMAGGRQQTVLDSPALVPAIALLTMLAMSAGTIAWTRRERRRTKRDDPDHG